MSKRIDHDLTTANTRRNLPTIGQQLRAASEKIHADELAALESKLQKAREFAAREFVHDEDCRWWNCATCGLYMPIHPSPDGDHVHTSSPCTCAIGQLLAILGEPEVKNGEP